MLTLLDELTADEAMPDGTFDSARPKQQQAQLELFELDSNTTTFSTYVEEDPIVHRRIIRNVDDNKWIRRIAKEIEEIVPYWSWQKYISNLVDALSGSVAKQVRNILKKAARKVAVKTAQGQPPFHKYSNYRPKSCQVFRFGPQARGPPRPSRRYIRRHFGAAFVPTNSDYGHKFSTGHAPPLSPASSGVQVRLGGGVARDRGANPNQVFSWRRPYEQQRSYREATIVC